MLRLSEAGQLEADLTIMYPPRFLVRRARHERKFNTPKTGTEKGEVIEVCPQLPPVASLKNVTEGGDILAIESP